MIKIGIVGPQEDKWTEEQQLKVENKILSILYSYAKHGASGIADYSNVRLVSGHCPKGGVDIWAEEMADSLGIKKEIFAPEVNQWNDKFSEWIEGSVDYAHGTSGKWYSGYKSRNIKIAKTCDILFCIVPSLNSNIYKYNLCWYHESVEYDKGKMIHYLSHLKNGGCWTMEYAKKLGKETHLVVIE